MSKANCVRRSGAHSRQAGTMAMLIGWGAQACTAFASSKDTLALGSGDDPAPAEPDPPALAGRGSMLALPPVCAEAAQCSPRLVVPVWPAGVATVEPATEDAGLQSPMPDAGDAALSDAGAANPPDAAVSEPPDAEVPSPCQGPGEFSDPASSTCYLWVSELATWTDAREACLQWGGSLARIDSARQDELLAEHMSLDSWLGANDLGSEGQMVWQDGTRLTFSNWAPGEPNDFQGQEDCAEKLVPDQVWNDARCFQPNAYFCQRSLR